MSKTLNHPAHHHVATNSPAVVNAEAGDSPTTTPESAAPAAVEAFTAAAAELDSHHRRLLDLQQQRDSSLSACFPAGVGDDDLDFAATSLAALKALAARNWNYQSGTREQIASAVQRLESQIEAMLKNGCWSDALPAIHLDEWAAFFATYSYRPVKGVHVERENDEGEYYAIKAADLSRDERKRRLLDYVTGELGELPTIAGQPIIVIPANHRAAWGIWEQGRDYVPAGVIVELTRHVLTARHRREQERAEREAAERAAAEAIKRRERASLIAKWRELVASDPATAEEMRSMLAGTGAAE